MPASTTLASAAPVLGRLGRRRQIALPKSICDSLGLHEGDFVETRLEGNKITLTPKSDLDQRLAEALDDLKHGRTFGPFATHEEFVASLRSNARKLRAKPPKPKRR